MSIYTVWASWACSARRGQRSMDPMDWSYRRLLVTKVKEMEPESSGRAAGALNQ